MNDSSLGGGWLSVIIIILIVLMGFNGGFGFGGNNATVAGYATTAEVQNSINSAFAQQNAQNILLSSANNNFEVARLIDNQTMALTNQNNANLINAIQGYNTLGLNLQNGFATLNQSIANLGYKMEDCCCSIKTMMLENRLQDAQTTINQQFTAISNAEQSQYILSQLGSFTPKTAAIL